MGTSPVVGTELGTISKLQSSSQADPWPDITSANNSKNLY